MYLHTLHLRQFRNYVDQQIEFLAPKTILVGDNAQGKSNLLEAVELLATLRSHRTNRDRELVRDGEAIGGVAATLSRAIGSIDMALTFRRSGRRNLALNQVALNRQVDFLGTLNAVQFSSLDLELVRGGPEARRTWLDTLLLQLEPVYAHILQQYNQVLRQRNALLKQGSAAELMELALWDAQLVTTGCRVIRRRARAIARLLPFAQFWHQAISGHREELSLQYVSSVLALAQENAPTAAQPTADEPTWIQQAFQEKLHQRAIAEQHHGTTLVGPHRDELEFLINCTPARQYGSQGQQRTLVLALKLAELELLEQVTQEPPILLLDDVLAELDPHRQNQLLEAIQARFQTLITTTHLGSFDAQWLRSSQILQVVAGQIERSI